MKRLRYACDFFAASFAGAAAQPYIKRLRALQDILGDLNDIAVARRLLAEIARLAGGACPATRMRSRRERMLVIVARDRLGGVREAPAVLEAARMNTSGCGQRRRSRG